MNRDWFSNVSNFDLVKVNLIRDLINASISLLLVNFLTVKMLHTCTYCLTFTRC